MQEHETGFPEYLRSTVKKIREDYSVLVSPGLPEKKADTKMSEDSPKYYGK